MSYEFLLVPRILTKDKLTRVSPIVTPWWRRRRKGTRGAVPFRHSVELLRRLLPTPTQYEYFIHCHPRIQFIPIPCTVPVLMARHQTRLDRRGEEEESEEITHCHSSRDSDKTNGDIYTANCSGRIFLLIESPRL